MRILVIQIAILATVTPMHAMAYIDPGSGSAIMSAIIGFFVATAMVVKTYWYKIKSIFTGSKSVEAKSSAPNDKDGANIVSPDRANPGASTDEKQGRANEP